MEIPHTSEWDGMTPEEKKRKLYEQQVELLENFRERRAISEEQYQKSYHDLTEKMGYTKEVEQDEKN